MKSFNNLRFFISDCRDISSQQRQQQQQQQIIVVWGIIGKPNEGEKIKKHQEEFSLHPFSVEREKAAAFFMSVFHHFYSVCFTTILSYKNVMLFCRFQQLPLSTHHPLILFVVACHCFECVCLCLRKEERIYAPER